jgi:hypothetical protein
MTITLIIEAARTSETSVSFYDTTAISTAYKCLEDKSEESEYFTSTSTLSEYEYKYNA